MICESRCRPLFPTDLASVETRFAIRTRNGHLAPADPVSVVPRFDNLVEFPNRQSTGMKPDGAGRQPGALVAIRIAVANGIICESCSG